MSDTEDNRTITYGVQGGYLYASQLAGLSSSNILVFGAAIAARWMTLEPAGCVFNQWRYDNNVWIALFYDRSSQEAEAWYGKWTKQEDKFVVTDPIFCGLIDRKFPDEKAVRLVS